MACRNSWIIEIACLFNRLSYASLLSGLRKTSPPFWGFETMFFGRQNLFRVWKSGDFLRWTVIGILIIIHPKKGKRHPQNGGFQRFISSFPCFSFQSRVSYLISAGFFRKYFAEGNSPSLSVLGLMYDTNQPVFFFGGYFFSFHFFPEIGI